jgi:hypothetical protein
MFPLTLDIYFEIGAFIISLLCFRSLRDKPLKWFIPFLFFIIMVELTGRHIRKDLHLPNSWLYNISIPLEYCFYTFLFYKSYTNRLFRQTAVSLLILFPAFCIVNILFLQGFYSFNTNILLVGNCITIILCCQFFVDLFQREVEINLLVEPMFWISTGLLFFNIGELSYSMFYQYLLQHRHDATGKLFILIHKNLIYFLYSFISIGILCTRIRYRKT